MTFAKMMHGVAYWHNSHVTAKSELPLKLTFEVGNVDLACEVLHALNREIEVTIPTRQGIVGPAVELNRPFQFMGIIVEFTGRTNNRSGAE